MITTALVFDHRDRTRKDKSGPLEVRITVDRRSYYINTGLHILKTEWNGAMVINRFDSDELNERLQLLKKRVDAAINDQLTDNREIDVQEIRKALYRTVSSRGDISTELIDWCEEQVATLNIREGTKKHYYTMLFRLKEFGGLRRWRDLTVENIYQWDAFLRSIKKQPTNPFAKKEREPIGQSTVYNYHKWLKALLYRAERFGIIERNPYTLLHGEFPRGDKQTVEYLTEEEMQRLVQCRPLAGTVAAKVRDLFVFQMYTGLSYSDAQAFDFTKYKEVDGRYVIRGERIKSGVPYVNQLLPPAIDVLQRNDWHTPKIKNADYNKMLHVIGEVLGISTQLHSHLARHTFATFMLSNGVKIENVSKMLGHTNITQTQRYAKVLEQSLRNDFDMIEEKIKNA